MMKKLFAFLVPFSACIALFAQSGTGDMSPMSYVVVGGNTPIEIVDAPEGVKLLHRTWGPESERKFSVRIYAPTSTAEWRRVSVKLKPAAGRGFYLAVGGEEEKSPSGLPRRAAFYDNFSVNGKLLPNGGFENGQSEWTILRRGEFPARLMFAPRKLERGGRVAFANSSSAVYRKFTVDSDGVFELSFDVRGAEVSDFESDVPLNLRKFANMGFVDENPSDGIGGWTDEGAKKSFKKLRSKVGRTKFEGILFDILNPEKNSGSSVLTFSSKSAPVILENAEIDLSEEGVASDFLYLLHTAVDDGKIVRGGTFAYVAVTYEDGPSKTFPLHFGTDVGDCWKPDRFARNAKTVLLASKKRNRGALYLSRFPLDSSKKLKSVELKSRRDITWVVVAATLSDRKVLTCETVTPQDNPDWVAADMPEDATVIDGSALDMRIFGKPEEAGKYGRVVVSPRGTMAFEKRPEKDVRFKGFTFYPQEFLRGFDAAQARENSRLYAAQLPKNGYNLVRISFDYIKGDSLRAERSAEYDKIDFLISELKRNGVYIHLPLAWYDIGTKNYHFFKRNDVKFRAIIGEPEARAMWRETALEQLNHYNPYTKLAWKDDPVFQVIEYYNELNICFNCFDQFLPSTQELVRKRWRQWLAARYGTVEKLNAAWSGAGWAKGAGHPLGSFESAEVPRGGFDWERFCQDATAEFLEFCRKTVRDAGYKGIVVQRNLGRSPFDAWMRGKTSESVITNSYYEHPSGLYTPGSDHTCGQASSIATEAGYWRTIAVSKIFDRPLTATEYNHCYWNKHRFEMMSLFAPYSAFQNFSTLVIHANAVEWKPRARKALSPFNVRESPAIRCAELFNQSFFMRGDIKPSERRVDMLVSKKFADENRNALYGFGGQQMRIPLMVGFAVKPDSPTPEALRGVKPKNADVEITPNGSSEVITAGWFQTLVDSNNGTFDISKFVEELKKRGILPRGNASDPANGVYQTDTGQITMDSKNMTMKVVSDFSCAATVHKSAEVDMGALKLLHTSVPASVGVVSLDGRKISESSRLVFAYATEESNIDSLTSFDGVLSIREGRGPIVMRRGKVRARLKLDASKKYSVYPIALNGARRERLDLKFENGVLEIDIDNGKLGNGAVAMFEIVAE